MKKYTIDDYREAERAAQEAQEHIGVLVKQQAEERGKALSAIARLDKAMAPLERAQEKAASKLSEMRRRRLGPWKDSEYGQSRILIHGSTDECWGRRVWLRVAKRDGRKPEWQWEADIDTPDGGRENVVLGPENGPRATDLQDRKRKVEGMLIKMGYILAE